MNAEFDLYEELKKVIKSLDKNKIPYALSGGLAYSILVETRATEDIDLLIYPDDWQRIPGILKPLGYLSIAEEMNFHNIQIRRLTKIGKNSILVLDFLLAEGKFVEGIQRSLKIDYENQEYKIVPPDILIEMKKGRLSGRDKNDIEGLMKLLEKNQ